MNRRTNIVEESRLRQFGCPCAAADRIARFKHANRPSCAGNLNRRRKTIGAGADYDCVEFHGNIVSLGKTRIGDTNGEQTKTDS